MTELKQINPSVLVTLKAYLPQLTPQQYRTLRGQVLAGDGAGAMKGLQKILRRRRVEVSGS